MLRESIPPDRSSWMGVTMNDYGEPCDCDSARILFDSSMLLRDDKMT